MERIRKVDRWEARRKAQFGGSNCEWVDWLPRSLHCAAANCAAAPVGMTELQTDRVSGPSTLLRTGGLGSLRSRMGMLGGRRVSEWDTGVELMQEWKFGLEGKASVCKGIWWKWIGKRPAVGKGSK